VAAYRPAANEVSLHRLRRLANAVLDLDPEETRTRPAWAMQGKEPRQSTRYGNPPGDSRRRPDDRVVPRELTEPTADGKRNGWTAETLAAYRESIALEIAALLGPRPKPRPTRVNKRSLHHPVQARPMRCRCARRKGQKELLTSPRSNGYLMEQGRSDLPSHLKCDKSVAILAGHRDFCRKGLLPKHQGLLLIKLATERV
jgi:hypothetical protein